MQDMVGRVEDPAEQIQLLAQNLKGQPMRLVVPGDKVDHGDIALLAVPMAAPDALLDALRVPRQIVVDDRLAKLQVQPFCAGLGAHEHLRARAELVHECKPHGRPRDSAWLPAESGRLPPVAIGRALAAHARDRSRRGTR